MKNILLSTIGASPQVLTETLYAIAQSGRPFPDEVYVITTLSSQETLINGLLRDGQLDALQKEYNLPDFCFDSKHIWLIKDDKGEPIFDAKTIDDQTFMADYITRKVYELTQDEDCAIHASLAGGRKTMAFYFGYAMSMFGRAHDTLSHVFVDDEYEFVKDFWFPAKQSKWVTGKNGQGQVDVSKATVTLAEIPFVRMRKSIDPSILDSMSSLSFSQTVGMLNSTHQEHITVSIHTSSKLINVLGVDIKLTAKEIAFYLWLLEKGQAGVLVDRYFELQTDKSVEFLQQYFQVAKDPRVFASFNTTPEDFIEGDYSTLQGMNKEFLQPIRSNINSKLNKALPALTAEKLEILSVADGGDQRYTVALCNSDIVVSIV